MEKVKPLKQIVGRTGGKRLLKNRIVDNIPPHEVYVEPFVGSGAVFFGRKFKANVEVLNDLDKDIFHIFKDSQAVGDKLKGKSFRPTREKYFRLLRQTKFRSPLERLYRNIYVSRNSFGSNRTSYIGEKAEASPKFMKAGGTLDKWQNSQYKDRLKDVRIFNQDYKKLLKRWDSPETFFYLDPPYSRAAKNKDYVEVGVTINEVYDAVKNLKGKFILSYDDVPEARKLFSEFNITKVPTKYSDGTGGTKMTVCELLISNYPLKIDTGKCKKS
jgi:DNA adenine methylase